MTPESYAQVSNLLIPTATVIYAIAMVSHASEWALGRAVVKVEAKEEVLVTSDGAPASAGTTTPSAAGLVDHNSPSLRMAAASRVGVLLTCLAFVLHLAGVVTRGL